MNHSDALFNEAVRHHQAGRLRHAEEIYRLILRTDAQQPDCLHMLGVAAYQTGRLDIAADLIGQAIAVRGDVASWHSNLGGVYKDAGQLDLAQASYERAIELDPTLAAARCNLAGLLRLRGQLDAALGQYEQAIAVAGGFAEAHFGLGSILQLRGRLDEAAASLQRAIAFDPAHADAHNSLGYLFHVQGRLSNAVDCYRRALELQPDHIDACNNLGYSLHAMGDLDAAADVYERALALRPDFAPAHNNLGNVRKDQGDFAAARLCYDRAIQIDPQYAAAYFNRADITKHRIGDTALTDLQRLAEKADSLPIASRARVHFGLGKALDDIGDYGSSFAHLRQGNTLHRSQIGYDEQVAEKMFRAVADVFDAQMLGRLRESSNPSCTPIFIVGMPRSGTTLIEQILSSHPLVHGGGELLTLDAVIADVLRDQHAESYPRGVRELDAAGLRSIGNDYLLRLPRPPSSATRITDKLPGNFVHVGLLHALMPNARIIHARRNPIDTCVSCFAKLFDRGQEFSYDLAELGRYYRSYWQLMAHWRAVLPAGAMLEIEYEELVHDSESQARRMIEYCGLPWDESCLGFHRTARPIATASALQVRQSIYDTSIGRWRRHADDLALLLNELAGIV